MSEPCNEAQSINIAILTVSDTRDASSDRSGQTIRHYAEAESLQIVDTQICVDAIPDVREHVQHWLLSEDVNVIITTGGSGLAKRDVTIEAIEPLLSKKIEGFGELFRYLSYVEDVGTRALLSRATAGVADDKVIFVLPGSTAAVKLAMTKLIIPELRHLVYEVNKHKNESE